MLNFNSVMIGTAQIEAMAAFYEKVFRRPADMAEGGFHGWQVGDSFLSIGEHSDVEGTSKTPARIMLNFETEEVDKEFDRLKSLGAEVIKEPYEMGDAKIATLADPDGNYFQLMTPWEMPN